MKSASAVIILMCLVVVFHPSYSRICYKCKSKTQPGCSKLATNSNYSIECPKDFQCSIKLYSKGNDFITSRACEPEGVSHHIKLWNKNKCNYKKKENTTLQKGGVIQCYNCTSINMYNMKRPNRACEIIDSAKYLVNCKDGEVCGKYEARYPNGSIYILDRRCVSKEWKLEFQMICYNDNCNNMEMPSKTDEHTLNSLKKLEYLL